MSIHGFGKLLDTIELKHGREFRDAVVRRVLMRQGVPHWHFPYRGAPSKIPLCGKIGCDGSCLDVACDGSSPYSRQEAAVEEAMRAWVHTERRNYLVIAGVFLAFITMLWYGSWWMQERSRQQAEQRLETEWQGGQLDSDRCVCPAVKP